jgi:exodeoxyribonuclease VII small subunit
MHTHDTMQEQSKSELSLEQCLGRLTAINEGLSGGRLDVEQALAQFEEGVRLHARASDILSRARLRVSQLVTKPESDHVQVAGTAPAVGDPEDEDDLPF